MLERRNRTGIGAKITVECSRDMTRDRYRDVETCWRERFVAGFLIPIFSGRITINIFSQSRNMGRFSSLGVSVGSLVFCTYLRCHAAAAFTVVDKLFLLSLRTA